MYNDDDDTIDNYTDDNIDDDDDNDYKLLFGHSFSLKHGSYVFFRFRGARHGLKLNGKLKRIEEHDKVAMSEPW